MKVEASEQTMVTVLQDKATRLRIDSVRSTTEAGSGHPTSCASAADSDLEGHPTTLLPFVDVATGSLGQGLSVGVGIAVHAKRFDHSDQRVFVLMGDGESAEGSVWEAAQWAALHNLNNLCAIIDINRLGQSQPTMLQWELEIYKARWEAFGWQALLIDGHSIPDLIAAFESATQVTDRPTHQPPQH